MTSKLLTLVKILGSRGGVKTTTKPNAWATVAWWRRYFISQQQQEEEQLDAIRQIIDEELPTRRVRPIADDQVVQARLDFSRAFFRSLTTTRDLQVSPRQPLQVSARAERHQQLQQIVQQIVQQPNLQVPVGDEYMHLAQ